MRFKTLKLYTHILEAELHFYSEILGFELIDKSNNTFTVKVGWSMLTFERSEKISQYHYCFLIPANQLHQALKWMSERVDVIELDKGKNIHNFKTWNADSFYFYDASGNIAECIVRYDLNTNNDSNFDSSNVLCINEIGMPTANVDKLNKQLETELHTRFWKGDLKIFGTNGSQEGLFLLPNYEVKDTWFPTSINIKPEPFEAVVDNGTQDFKIVYRDKKLTTKAL
ncbi:VOC family protein [Psychroserpens damuponensis]|uniref:VOC family protein n=1 Tax=Psychroserpens damuponensis TaxID=943936 RepID=UPI00059144A7|nr:glyoxalase [Psychroserpens damuponensis]